MLSKTATTSIFAYSAEGYLVIPQLLSKSTIDAILEDFQLIINESSITPPAFKALGDAKVFDILKKSCFGAQAFGGSGGGKSIDTLGHGFHNIQNSTIRRLLLDEEFQALIRQFPIVKPTICMSKGIMKPAKTGSKVPPHADDQYFWTEPNSGFTFWFALDDANENNGGIEVIPGSHLQYLPGDRFCCGFDGKASWVACHQKDEENMDRISFPKSNQDQLDWVKIDAPAGTLIVMNRSLIHRSSANTSNTSRRALTLHFIDGACDFPSDNWIPYDSLFEI